MHCKGCGYILSGLATRRCPECGLAFNPDDASTFQKSVGRDLRSMRSIARRAGIGLLVASVWFVATMQNASANTSWEHHPFAGVFIMVKESLRESHSISDWALALLVWGFFLGMVVYWVISGKAWAALLVLALCAVTIMMSLMAASWASC